ncbi:MAG: hypothetical protein M3P41_02250 [Actinomycetota bacterium]|nr:hypothetical protein [Actinomycetota bacterium]
MFAGFLAIMRERALRVLVVAGMVSLIAVGIVDVASYPLSLDLHGGAAGYGAMTGLLGGGGLLGAAVAGRALRAGATRVLFLAFAAGAAGLAVAGAAPVLLVALTGMALAGGGRGLADVASITIIQARAADEVRSRVFAAQDGAAHAAFSVSAFAGGLIVQVASARAAFATAAACGVGAALIAARMPGSRSPGA